ncbi:MAG TPA: proton-conducting transporter membrane subunit [Caldilineaceae bacterium]|nr:proton-conducting transporter membrane subunit [Caldilineaceae bacterium]
MMLQPLFTPLSALLQIQPLNGGETIFYTFPVLVVGSLLVMAMATFLLRTWERVTAAAATIFTATMALWLWRLDPTTTTQALPLTGRVIDLRAPFTHLGFRFELQPGSVAILITILLLATVAFALAFFISQGSSFVPFTLALLAGYTALSLLTVGPLPPPLLTPLALVLLSCVSAFVLQAGRLSEPTGPLRFLIPPILAFPLFLVAQWYIEQMPLNPQDQGPVESAALLLTIGLLFLLAPVPLHGAMPATMESAPPIVSTLVTLLYQLALLHLLFRLVDLYPFMTTDSPFELWLTWAGLITTVWAGLAAAGAIHPGRLWGYAALHDWGLILMLLAIPSPTTWPLALFLFALRAASMLTAAAGLAVLEQHIQGFGVANLRGAGNRLPWNSAAFLLGGLGLTGFPLSAGFTGHWAALQIIAAGDWRPAALVLLASVGAIWGFVRLTRILFGPLQNRLLLREQMPSVAVALVMLLVSVALAISPQLLDGPVRSAWIAFGG